MLPSSEKFKMKKLISKFFTLLDYVNICLLMFVMSILLVGCHSNSIKCAGIKTHHKCSRYCEHNQVNSGTVIVNCSPKDFVHVRQL